MSQYCLSPHRRHGLHRAGCTGLVGRWMWRVMNLSKHIARTPCVFQFRLKCDDISSLKLQAHYTNEQYSQPCANDSRAACCAMRCCPGCSTSDTASHAIATRAPASTRSNAMMSRCVFRVRAGGASPSSKRIRCSSLAIQTPRWMTANTTTTAFHAGDGQRGQIARLNDQ